MLCTKKIIGPVVAVACCLFTSQAMADVSMFASTGTKLFRISGSAVESFDVGVEISALDFDMNGVLWGTGVSPGGSDYRVYTIADPFGTPTAQVFSSPIISTTTSLQWIDQTLYAVQREGSPSSGSFLRTLDPVTGAQTPVGVTGSTNAVIGGIAVDEVSGAMYAMDGATAELSAVDWQLQNGSNPSATLIGALGLSPDGGGGLDFHTQSNTLYGLLALGGSPNNRPVGVYTIDTNSGLATELVDLDPFAPGQGSFGFAIIPEPSSLVLMLLAASVIRKGRR